MLCVSCYLADFNLYVLRDRRVLDWFLHSQVTPEVAMFFGYLTRHSLLSLLVVVASINLACSILSPVCPLAHLYLHFFCHQNPARTFALGPYHCGLCARCAGVYSGLIVAFLLFRFFVMHPSLILFCVSIAVISICLKVAAIDVPNVPRFSFGACLGVAMFFLISFSAGRLIEAFTASLLHVERKLTPGRSRPASKRNHRIES